MTDQIIDPGDITLPPTYSADITVYLLNREKSGPLSIPPESTGPDPIDA